MAAQPLNADISVFYNVRSKRQAKQGGSIAANIYRLRPLVMAVPGIDGDPAEVLTRDTSKSDFSPYASSGFPRVYGEHGETTLADAISHVTGAGFAFKIGQDKFLPQAEDALDEDLYGSVKSVDATYAQA